MSPVKNSSCLLIQFYAKKILRVQEALNSREYSILYQIFALFDARCLVQLSNVDIHPGPLVSENPRENQFDHRTTPVLSYHFMAEIFTPCTNYNALKDLFPLKFTSIF